MFNNILITIKDRVGIIEINRPESRNSLNVDTLKEIERAMDLMEKDESVGVIIFTGTGSKSFASGADIKQLREREMLDALIPGIQATYKKIEDCSKATIAAINGYALGGGFELCLACDIRVASENIKLGLPELNLAIIPGGGGTQRLSRIVGKGKAMEMILTGKIIDEVEALQYGIVSKIVTKDLLISETIEVAKSIISKGPIAVRLAKIAINKGFDTNLETGLMIEKLAQTIAFGTADKNEGTSAFLEKRSPNFTNN